MKKELIAKLKRLSNLGYCGSEEDMELMLEEIHKELNKAYPEVEEEV
jgi:hypothetical protein